jgi:hypothetical protein
MASSAPATEQAMPVKLFDRIKRLLPSHSYD